METKQVHNTEIELNGEEKQKIATRFNCHPDYVTKLINGDREVNSVLAKKIMKAVEFVKETKAMLNEAIDKSDFDAE
jgi:hypothetical protein